MLGNDDVAALINRIESLTGISLPETNRRDVVDHVRETMEEKSLSFTGYLTLLSRDRTTYDELIKKVTINETYFFREERQFAYLRDHLFPLWSRSGGNYNIWSASCSSGEEPLSLLALAESVFSGTGTYRIYSSDICQERLDLFSEGRYRPNSFRADGKAFKPYLAPFLSGREGEDLVVSPRLIQRIDRSNINLFKEIPSALPVMDLIFLRNTLIYMDERNKKIILDNVVAKLKPGGFLFLATAEIPLIYHPALMVEEKGGVYFFKKRDPATPVGEPMALRIRKAMTRDSHGQDRAAAELKDKAQRIVAVTPAQSAEDRVCRVISLALNNSTYQREEPAIEEAASYLLGIINSENRDESRDGDFQGLIPGLICYARGLNRYRENDKEKAALWFEKSLGHNGNLWPARYHLMNCQPPGSETIRRHLAVLTRDIKDYIDKKRYDFQFMLEGFNAGYFLMICEKRLAKEEEHLYHGSR